MTLSLGGTVYLAENVLALAGMPHAERISLINTVPSAMVALLDSGPLPASVRVVNLAGEPFQQSLITRIYGEHGVERVYNLYGPSEDTTYSTGTLMPEDPDHVPHIGKPISGTTFLLADSSLNPVVEGETGEILLAGAGLALGYLGRPGLTAEKFVPNPDGEPGGRLYRTGDLGRLLPGGDIFFQGRIDHQVKLRGFRIELGEIEHALDGHGDVQRSLVTVYRGEGHEDGLLTAYIQSGADEQVLAAQLEDELTGSLPHYMVPGAFVVLENFPLTPNGKIDRNRLFLHKPTKTSTTLLQPRTEMEQALAGIWQEVLGFAVGVDQDFLRIGGHSLLAFRISSRTARRFGLKLDQKSLFQYPTIERMAVHLEDLQRGEDGRSESITPVPRDIRLPLSPMQQRLWLTDQVDPGHPAYGLPMAFLLEGNLDVSVLEQALVDLAARHEILRTQIPADEEGPRQQILPPSDSLLEIVACVDPVDPAILVEQWANLRFDLANGPLFQVQLAQLAPRKFLLLINLHHIISDGWSNLILLQELGAAYRAFKSGGEAPTEPPIQFADLAVYQEAERQQPQFQDDLEWWRECLTGVPTLLKLPLGKGLAETAAYQGKRVSRALEATRARAFLDFCASHQVTPVIALLTVFQSLLARYSRERLFLIGTPTANRHPDAGNLIGFFVNTLVLRADFRTTGQSFTDHLERVQRNLRESDERGRVPFDSLIEVLQPERDPNHSPLIQAVLSYEDPSVGRLELPDISEREIRPKTCFALFDLTLFVEKRDDESLEFRMDFARGLFNEAEVDLFLCHLIHLIEVMQQHPHADPLTVSLLTDSGEISLDDAAFTPEDTPCIHHLFEQHAARDPEHPALVFGDQTWSYDELNKQANQLAFFLMERGVAPDQLVGVHSSRDAETVISMLAILKAGAAYVPLDPEYPADRLAYMVADAGPAAVISRGDRVADLPAGANSICLDGDGAAIAAMPGDNPNQAVFPLNQAYVTYTSGSTGKPKGAAVVHGAVVHLLHQTNWEAIGPADRVAQASNTVFDAATMEIWGALLNGATLIGVPRDTALSPQGLQQHLRKHDITFLFLTTSLFNQHAQQIPDLYAGLPHVCFGGEAADPASIERVSSEGPPRRLTNCYGPTETTVLSASFELSEALDTIPIGSEVRGDRLLILDAKGRILPLGMPGELCVGGMGLARGYLKRPALTAERFIPDPSGSSSGERLYRTGDLAVKRADGLFYYLGRLDHQIKLRGYRIELGEIQSVLEAHEGVAMALVMVSGSGNERWLAAYLQVEEGVDQDTLADSCLAHAREHLPDYMVPAAVVLLESFPLNANGKIDHRALPKPQRTDHSAERTAPRNERERLLAELWCGALGLEEIGIHDDFFRMGGQSLLAIRLLAEVGRRLNRTVPIRVLFQNPTVARLAEYLEETSEPDRKLVVQDRSAAFR